MVTNFIISTYNTQKHCRQKHTICMIFMIPVYPTRENTGLKTHSEAPYNAIEVGGGGLKGHQIKLQYITPFLIGKKKLLLNMQF